MDDHDPADPVDHGDHDDYADHHDDADQADCLLVAGLPDSNFTSTRPGSALFTHRVLGIPR